MTDAELPTKILNSPEKIPETETWKNLEKEVLDENGEIAQLDKQLLVQSQEIRNAVKKRDQEFLNILYLTLLPQQKLLPQNNELFSQLSQFKFLDLPPEYHPFKVEAQLAVMRKKIFDGSFQDHIPQNKILLLQQIIEKQDEELSSEFYKTDFGRANKELRDNTVGLLSKDEVTALETLNDFFITKGQTVFKQLFEVDDADFTTGEVFLLQKKRLEKIFQIDPQSNNHPTESTKRTMIDSALRHIKAVTSQVWERTESPLATLIAAHHDFFKHSLSADGRPQVELGLHEVGSSVVGSKVIIEIVRTLHEQFPEDVPELAIMAAEKFSKKAISVHGEYEFPFVMSMRNPLFLKDMLAFYGELTPDSGYQVNRMKRLKIMTLLRQLFGSLYPVTEISSTIKLTEDGVVDNKLRYDTMAVSMVDELEGAEPRSFGKYNDETPTERVLSNESVAHYIAHHILQSVTGCFEVKLLQKLNWQDLEMVKQLQNKASLLLLLAIDVCDPNFKNNPNARHQLLFPLLAGTDNVGNYHKDRRLLLPKNETFYKTLNPKFQNLYKDMQKMQNAFLLLKHAKQEEQVKMRQNFNKLMNVLMQNIDAISLEDIQQNEKLQPRLKMAWDGLKAITYFNES